MHVVGDADKKAATPFFQCCDSAHVILHHHDNLHVCFAHTCMCRKNLCPTSNSSINFNRTARNAVIALRRGASDPVVGVFPPSKRKIEYCLNGLHRRCTSHGIVVSSADELEEDPQFLLTVVVRHFQQISVRARSMRLSEMNSTSQKSPFSLSCRIQVSRFLTHMLREEVGGEGRH